MDELLPLNATGKALVAKAIELYMPLRKEAGVDQTPTLSLDAVFHAVLTEMCEDNVAYVFILDAPQGLARAIQEHGVYTPALKTSKDCKVYAETLVDAIIGAIADVLEKDVHSWVNGAEELKSLIQA